MVLKIQNVKKNFKGKKILNGVNFSLKRGEIVGLIGNNGAGKTTLIKCIMNLYNYEGTVNIDSVQIEKNTVPNNISFSLEPHFFSYMTAEENLQLLNIDNKDINKLLETVGLENSKKKR